MNQNESRIILSSALAPLTNLATELAGVVFAFMGILFIFALIVRWNRSQKLSKSGIQDIDRMAGRTFEEYLAVVFRQKGFKVTLTPAAKDQGADLVLSKDGIKTVVQAKRWKGKVGNKAVQEVVASKAMYKADRSLIVTNSFYTKSAVELARVNQVELWDRNRLVSELVRADAKTEVHAQTQMNQATQETAATVRRDHRAPSVAPTPTCPRCQAPLVRRAARKDGSAFWGCSAYPRCRYTKLL